MTRKTKIIAVDVAPPEQEINEPEPKTDAEQLTELVGTINSPPVVNDVKPKAKRISKRKHPSSDDDMKIQEVKQEVIQEVIPDKPVEYATDSKPKKTLEKVSCPDCGKSMTSKTLKYNHVYNCQVKKQAATNESKQSEIITNEEPQYEPNERQQKVDILIGKMRQLKTEQLNRRAQKMEKLMANAF